ASPELGVPSFNVVATHRVNYDDVAAASATDSVEASNPGWTVSGDAAALPNVYGWQRRALSPTQHVWWGPDNNGQRDGVKLDLPDEQILTSPVLSVGSGPLVISFTHRFSFENGGWDGGVIELSNDGGATWVDIGVGSYNGSTSVATNAPIGAGRPAFVNRMTGWPNFANVTRTLGTTYANQNVQIRFRVGSDDSTGAPGWQIDNIAISGLTNTPFGGLVAEAAACSN
ncbi:MAG TPA: peptidase M36, partial [Thermoanaerobaculia bacterium]